MGAKRCISCALVGRESVSHGIFRQRLHEKAEDTEEDAIAYHCEAPHENGVQVAGTIEITIMVTMRTPR